MPTVISGSVPENKVPTKPTETREGGSLAVHSEKSKILYVPFKSLTVRPEWNPRISLTNVKELADSIRATGQETALLVGDYEGETLVIRGHRRHAAMSQIIKSKELGLFDPNKVKVEFIGKISDIRAVRRLYVDQNTARLRNPLELGRACEALKLSGMTQDEISKHLGISRSNVQFYLGVMRLPSEVLTEYRAFLLAKDAGKETLEKAETPWFDQRTIQRLVTGWNLKNGLGRPEAVTDEKARDFDKLWTDWKADKGHTIVSEASARGVRSDAEIREMRANINGKAQPAVKDALLAFADYVLKVDGSEERVRAYLDL